MKQHPPHIALVAPDFSVSSGGVRSMAEFLYHTITSSERYTVDIVSLARSSRDSNSICVRSPASWLRGIRLTSHTSVQGIPYRHVGAFLAEFEFQRYQPRRVLTDLLNRYDLVQVVAGTPAWAYSMRHVQRPVCLFTATLIDQERTSLLRQQRGWYRTWMRLMTSFNRRLERAALPSMACVFAESEYTCQLLSALLPEQRLKLGLPGIDTRLFVPVAYCPDGYILSVGRFSDHRKNSRLLFAAYARLRQQCPHAPRLVLVGKSPLPQDWAYARSLGVMDHVDMHQDVSIQDLVRWYQAASLFVLSSNEEGLGIVLLEAMACGLPIVSTRCGGPETAVCEGETGYLTPVGDAVALADALQRLLEAPQRRQQMGQAGRQRAEKRFSLAAAGKVYLDQYDALLG